MSEIIKSVVYYNTEGLPVLCHDHDCMNCKHECFDAIVKIIPVEVDIEKETLGKLSKNLEQTNTSVGRFNREMKKTVDSLNKLKRKFK